VLFYQINFLLDYFGIHYIFVFSYAISINLLYEIILYRQSTNVNYAICYGNPTCLFYKNTP